MAIARNAESPGPVKNAQADKLKSVLGLTKVNYVETEGALTAIDSTLE